MHLAFAWCIHVFNVPTPHCGISSSGLSATRKRSLNKAIILQLKREKWWARRFCQMTLNLRRDALMPFCCLEDTWWQMSITEPESPHGADSPDGKLISPSQTLDQLPGSDTCYIWPWVFVMDRKLCIRRTKWFFSDEFSDFSLKIEMIDASFRCSS